MARVIGMQRRSISPRLGAVTINLLRLLPRDLFERSTMRRTSICVMVIALIGAFARADDLVPPDSKLELLYTRSAPIKGGLTEGVAAAPDGSMYFSEIPFGDDKGLIMRFDPRTKMTAIFARDSHKSNGLMFDAKGNLIACEGSDGGGRCVARWDVKTGRREVVADRYMGKRFNACNDLCIDEKGASTSPIPATSAPSRASWSTAPSIGSTPTARSSR